MHHTALSHSSVVTDGTRSQAVARIADRTAKKL